jgi:hypothetical protein
VAIDLGDLRGVAEGAIGTEDAAALCVVRGGAARSEGREGAPTRPGASVGPPFEVAAGPPAAFAPATAASSIGAPTAGEAP